MKTLLVLLFAAVVVVAADAPAPQISDRQQLELERLERLALEHSLAIEQLRKAYAERVEALRGVCAAGHAELKRSDRGEWSCQAAAPAR